MAEYSRTWLWKESKSYEEMLNEGRGKSWRSSRIYSNRGDEAPMTRALNRIETTPPMETTVEQAKLSGLQI